MVYITNKHSENRQVTKMVFRKDSAVRAKEVAERMFAINNIHGAMTFAVMAQNLFPTLEGITDMVTTLGMYICAAQKINGEPDWYHILGVDPSADDETMLRQYRKRSQALNPEVNMSIGVHRAFQLISDAWNLLSDKDKREAYDEKTKAKAVAQAANVVQLQQAYGRGKREREEAQPQVNVKIRKHLFAENKETVPMQQDTGSKGELQNPLVEEADKEISKKLDEVQTNDAGEKAVEEMEITAKK